MAKLIASINIGNDNHFHPSLIVFSDIKEGFGSMLATCEIIPDLTELYHENPQRPFIEVS